MYIHEISIIKQKRPLSYFHMYTHYIWKLSHTQSVCARRPANRILISLRRRRRRRRTCSASLLARLCLDDGVYARLSYTPSKERSKIHTSDGKFGSLAFAREETRLCFSLLFTPRPNLPGRILYFTFRAACARSCGYSHRA